MDDPESLLSQATTFLTGGHAAAALPLLRRALQLDPGSGRAHKLMGAAFYMLNEVQKAVPHLQNAANLLPDDFESQSNLAVALFALRRLDELALPLQRAIDLNPNAAEAHYLRAVYWLLLGDFEKGWPEYEWRWQSATRPYPKPNFPGSEWNGQPIPGKRLLLYAEQGFGDAIQFSRYLPILSAQGIFPVLAAPPELLTLLRTLPGQPEVVPWNTHVNYAFHCSLLSLPRLLRTRLETIPANVPYLRVDPSAATQWKSRLQTTGRHRKKIGLAWAGDSRHPHDRTRSCKLTDFAALSAVQADFYSLQKGPASRQAAPAELVVRDLTADLHTFADTAALILNLDLIISVDTAIVHLAGALGKPCWVLLPYAADWRWLHNRTDSPWYPTLRLFRQSTTGDWTGVLSEVVAALNSDVAQESTDGV